MKQLGIIRKYMCKNDVLQRNRSSLSLHTSCIKLSTPLQWSYSMAEVNRPLIGLTTGQMLQNSADKFGDTEAIISCHQEVTKTYTQLNKEANEFAAGLLSLGFDPGDRIGVWAPNCYEWCLSMFAAAKAGLIMVNINPAYRTNELKYCLEKVATKGIICASEFKTSNYYSMIADVIPEMKAVNPSTPVSSKILPNLKYVIKMDHLQQNGAFNFQNIFDAGRPEDRQRVEKLATQIQFDDPFNIQFTSGTTGKSKAVVLSHFNILNNAKFIGIRRGMETNKERVALCVPLFHCFGCVVGLLSNVMYGGTTILPSAGYDSKEILKSIQEKRVTSLLGTPTMYFDILREYKKDPFEIKYLHSGVMSGASCPKDLVLSCMEDLKMKNIVVAFGLTETSPVAYLGFPTDSVNIRTETVGYPLDQTESKVVDKNGKIVPIGVPGELLIRGYCVFLEYWSDEEKTKEVIGKDRWFKTGDITIMDEKRYLKIVGRIKDMIIRGGENIYPAEIESFFLGHKDITEAQVFGVPDERMGEEVAMWIIPKSKNLTQDDIKKWAKGKISHFKIPKYIMIVDDFPKTISGKVKKFEMSAVTTKKLMLKHE